MPNGGSDCCGTCWFNAKNEGQAGSGHASRSEPSFCQIRDTAIERPFYTYCANHPHRSPERLETPLGPIMTGDAEGNRQVWQPSPDTDEIRVALLAMLAAIEEAPPPEYPIGIHREDAIVWQLGEFRELRAVSDLERIAAFDPSAKGPGPFKPSRAPTVNAAKDALAKIAGEAHGA